MFDIFQRPEERDGRDFRRRTAVFLVALALHAGLVYFLYRARITVKILPDRAFSHRVILAPPVPRLTVPGKVEDIIGGTPAGATSSRATGSAAGGGGEPERDVPDIDALLEARQLSRAEPGSLPPEHQVTFLSKKFSLAAGTESRHREGALVLRLAPSPAGEPQPKPPAAGRFYPDPELMDYARTRLRGRSGAASAGAGSGQRATILIPEQLYDLSPWAREVVERIQSNWDLPVVYDLPPQTQVKVSVTIARNGEVSLFQVVGSTNSEALDRAAVEALKRSFPLPVLPADFPAESFEAVFIFDYNG